MIADKFIDIFTLLNNYIKNIKTEYSYFFFLLRL